MTKQEKSVYNKLYREKNKEKLRQKDKDKYLRNKENPEYKIKRKEYKKKYSQDNKDKIKQKNKEYELKYKPIRRKLYLENKENIIKIDKIRYENKRDYILEQKKQYRLNNLEKFAKKDYDRYHSDEERFRKEKREYAKNNRCKINKYFMHKYNTDTSFKVSVSLRARLRIALRDSNVKKSEKTFDLIGCSINDCIKHIEKQFTNNMSWENYGYYGWHIDHIKPCASFNLKDIEQQRLCFNYTNLQPLWWFDNLAKGKKFMDDGLWEK